MRRHRPAALLAVVFVHTRLHDIGDAGERAGVMQERVDGDLVSGVKHAGKRTPLLAGDFRELEATEGFHIRRTKRKLSNFAEVDTRCGSGPALGIRKRILDGNAHVGGTEMRHDRPVLEFDHGMNLGLPLDEHLDAIDIHAEQMHGLDALKTLVHKGGGVDGDLRTHVPRWMGQGIMASNTGQLIESAPIERAAGTCEPDAMCLARILTEQTLENGPVLRINGKHLTRLHHGHQQIATHDQGFLVGKRQPLAALENGMTGGKARGAHDCDEDHVYILELNELLGTTRTGMQFARGGQLREDRVATMRLRRDRHMSHIILTRKMNQIIGARMCAQRDDLKLVGVLLTDIERLRADRARTAENGNARTRRGIDDSHYRTPPR